MENILINKQGHIVVTDFGLSKWLSSGQKTSTVAGTLKYMGKVWVRVNEVACSSMVLLLNPVIQCNSAGLEAELQVTRQTDKYNIVSEKFFQI